MIWLIILAHSHTGWECGSCHVYVVDALTTLVVNRTVGLTVTVIKSHEQL